MKLPQADLDARMEANNMNIDITVPPCLSNMCPRGTAAAGRDSTQTTPEGRGVDAITQLPSEKAPVSPLRSPGNVRQEGSVPKMPQTIQLGNRKTLEMGNCKFFQRSSLSLLAFFTLAITLQVSHCKFNPESGSVRVRFPPGQGVRVMKSEYCPS